MLENGYEEKEGADLKFLSRCWDVYGALKNEGKRVKGHVS